ncbi:MAG: MATE family efflux transporter [Oceanicaulis sp.]|nr:MATE family efflux transporter [Oceanicaulis sp.]
MAATRAARDLTQGPVFRHILRMVIPMSFGIVAMMLVGVVDAYWVGRLGTAQQAAVQFVFPVSMLVMSIAIGLGAGAVSVVARAAGRGDHGRTRRVATDAVTLSFLVVLAVSVLGVVMIDPLFRALGATEAMMPFVREYMVIWFAGIVFIVGPMVASNLLRALGDAVIPSVIMIIAAVINMILDPLLIFGWGPFPRMEVEGAAMATLISNLVVFVIAMVILIWREKLIDFSFPGWSELIWNWREIARVGAPAAGSNMIGPLANTAVFAAMAGFGEPAVAGLGVGMRVEALAIIPMFALSGSIGPITGQNGGAGLTDRVREAFAKSFLFCLGWGLFVAVVLAALSPLLAPAFLPGEDGQAMARAYWLIAPFAVAGYGVAMAAAAGFNGLGRPLMGVAVNVFRGVVLVAPLAWLGGALGGATGVIWGVFAANLISGLIIAAVVLRLCPLTAVDGRARRAPAASTLSAGSDAPPAPPSRSAPDGDRP